MFLAQGYRITYLSFVIDHEGDYLYPRRPEDFDPDYWRSVEGPRLLFGRDSAEDPPAEDEGIGILLEKFYYLCRPKPSEERFDCLQPRTKKC